MFLVAKRQNLLLRIQDAPNDDNIAPQSERHEQLQQ